MSGSPPATIDLPGSGLRGAGRSLAELLGEPRVQSVVLGSSKDPNAKVTVLLMLSGELSPTMVVKAATTDQAAAAIEAERRVLVALQAILPPAIRTTVPKVLDVVEFEGRSALVTSALPGIPMTTAYHRWRHTARPFAVMADFAVARDWITRFQDGTAGPPTAIRMVAAVAERLLERFESEPDVGDILDGLSGPHERLSQASTPRTAVHGDFWYGNVMTLAGDVSGVVDWEAGATVGEPVGDLVRFGLVYALYLDRHTPPGRLVRGHGTLRAGPFGAGVVYAVDGRGWFPDLFRTFLETGLERLGAPAGLWRDAAVAGVAEMAATADNPEFAARHYALLRQLLGVSGRGAGRP